MTYNNYANYETYAVGLVIDNTRDLLEHWQEVARRIKENTDEIEQVTAGIWTADEGARFTLADLLKDDFEEKADEFELDAPFSDLLSAALSGVNWAELATELLEEV